MSDPTVFAFGAGAGDADAAWLLDGGLEPLAWLPTGEARDAETAGGGAPLRTESSSSATTTTTTTTTSASHDAARMHTDGAAPAPPSGGSLLRAAPEPARQMRAADCAAVLERTKGAGAANATVCVLLRRIMQLESLVDAHNVQLPTSLASLPLAEQAQYDIEQYLLREAERAGRDTLEGRRFAAAASVASPRPPSPRADQQPYVDADAPLLVDRPAPAVGQALKRPRQTSPRYAPQPPPLSAVAAAPSPSVVFATRNVASTGSGDSSESHSSWRHEQSVQQQLAALAKPQPRGVALSASTSSPPPPPRDAPAIVKVERKDSPSSSSLVSSNAFNDASSSSSSPAAQLLQPSHTNNTPLMSLSAPTPLPARVSTVATTYRNVFSDVQLHLPVVAVPIGTRVYIDPDVGYSGKAKKFKAMPDAGEVALIVSAKLTTPSGVLLREQCQSCHEYFERLNLFKANREQRKKILLVKNNTMIHTDETNAVTLRAKVLCASSHLEVPSFRLHIAVRDNAGHTIAAGVQDVRVRQWKKGSVAIPPLSLNLQQ